MLGVTQDNDIPLDSPVPPKTVPVSDEFRFRMRLAAKQIQRIHNLPTRAKAYNAFCHFQVYGDHPRVFRGSLKELGLKLERESVRGGTIGVAANVLDDSGRRTKLNVVQVRALVLDVDGAKLESPWTLEQIVAALPLAPSMVIATGSKDSYHLYWTLDEPKNLTTPEVEETVEGMALTLAALIPGGDAAMASIERAPRLAGFFNRKHTPPVLAEVVVADGPTYTWDALTAAIPVTIKPKPRAVVPPEDREYTEDEEVLDLVRDYLEGAEPAVSGAGGHTTTFRVVMAAGPGHALSPETCLELLEEIYNPRCCPPWSPEELAHKVADVYARATGWGWRLPEALDPCAARAQGAWGLDADEMLDEGEGPKTVNGHSPDVSIVLPVPEPRDLDSEVKVETEVEGGPKPTYNRFVEDDLAESYTRSKVALDFRWSEVSGCWYRWTGCAWEPDQKREVQRAYTGWLRSSYVPKLEKEVRDLEAFDESGTKAAANLSRKTEAWIKHILSDKGVNAVLNRVKHRARLDVSKLDTNDFLLNTPAGILDLKTLEVIPHNHQLVSRITSVTYNPEAACPRWLRFVNEITCGNQDLAHFLQVAAGYCLTGSTAEHLAFVLFGDGSNGKSVFTKVLRRILGTYAMSADKSIVTETRAEQHSAVFAQLEGARLVLVNELPGSKYFDSDRFKALVSGDEVNARGMRENFRNFVPRLKLVISTNYLPKVDDSSNGFWRRMAPVPFAATFEGTAVDPALEEKLVAEGAGILGWMLEGLRFYHAEGLAVPQVVKTEKESYRQSEDQIGEFIAACLEADPEGKSQYTSTEVFSLYLDWAKKFHHRALSQNGLSRQMKAHGIVPTKLEKASTYIGWRIKSSVLLEEAERRPRTAPSMNDFDPM